MPMLPRDWGGGCLRCEGHCCVQHLRRETHIQTDTYTLRFHMACSWRRFPEPVSDTPPSIPRSPMALRCWNPRDCWARSLGKAGTCCLLCSIVLRAVRASPQPKSDYTAPPSPPAPPQLNPPTALRIKSEPLTRLGLVFSCTPPFLLPAYPLTTLP